MTKNVNKTLNPIKLLSTGILHSPTPTTQTIGLTNSNNNTQTIMSVDLSIKAPTKFNPAINKFNLWLDSFNSYMEQYSNDKSTWLKALKHSQTMLVKKK